MGTRRWSLFLLIIFSLLELMRGLKVISWVIFQSFWAILDSMFFSLTLAQFSISWQYSSGVLMFFPSYLSLTQLMQPSNYFLNYSYSFYSLSYFIFLYCYSLALRFYRIFYERMWMGSWPTCETKACEWELIKGRSLTELIYFYSSSCLRRQISRFFFCQNC